MDRKMLDMIYASCYMTRMNYPTNVTPAGRTILDRLRNKSMSQAELARLIGMDRKLLTQCISGWRRLPRHWLPQIAMALDITGMEYERFRLAALEQPLRRPRTTKSPEAPADLRITR
jgi:cyanate lyase